MKLFFSSGVLGFTNNLRDSSIVIPSRLWRDK
jgi:hypothetical protein